MPGARGRREGELDRSPKPSRGPRATITCRGLKVETPIGPISFRASDGQSTMGAWVGTTKLDGKRGVGIMVNHEYIPVRKCCRPMTT